MTVRVDGVEFSLVLHHATAQGGSGMKTARISLAVVAGLLLASGFAAGWKLDRFDPGKIYTGLMFGTFLAFTMIRHPERVTKLTVGFMTVLLSVLVVHEFQTAPRGEALLTLFLSVVFVGVQVAFAGLSADPSVASASESKSVVHPKEF